MNTLFSEARRYIAGGVNSPVRAFTGIGRAPVFIEKGRGKYLYDTDGKRYVDYCLSWGALILGHAHADIVRAVTQAIRRGTSFGAPTRVETALARLVCKCMPSVERVRFVSSGTEAVMTALRLARAHTGRVKVLKFDGCYHGHSDAMLVTAGSGVAGLGRASSKGVPAVLARETLSVPFNDTETFVKIMEQHGSSIAAVIVEPVPANMGLVLPSPGFLQAIRDMTTSCRALLIFDEVITGFRAGIGGAQELFGIYPDLTCLGKIIGGGFPAAAVGGRRDIMKLLAPTGPVYQAGTLSGNPVAMSAGLTIVEYLRENPATYASMERVVSDFATLWRGHSRWTINTLGSMFTIFMTELPVRNFDDARGQDANQFAVWYRSVLDRGAYLPPSAFETAFVSPLHAPRDLRRLFKTH